MLEILPTSLDGSLPNQPTGPRRVSKRGSFASAAAAASASDGHRNSLPVVHSTMEG